MFPDVLGQGGVGPACTRLSTILRFCARQGDCPSVFLAGNCSLFAPAGSCPQQVAYLPGRCRIPVLISRKPQRNGSSFDTQLFGNSTVRFPLCLCQQDPAAPPVYGQAYGRIAPGLPNVPGPLPRVPMFLAYSQLLTTPFQQISAVQHRVPRKSTGRQQASYSSSSRLHPVQLPSYLSRFTAPIGLLPPDGILKISASAPNTARNSRRAYSSPRSRGNRGSYPLPQTAQKTTESWSRGSS